MNNRQFLITFALFAAFLWIGGHEYHKGVISTHQAAVRQANTDLKALQDEAIASGCAYWNHMDHRLAWFREDARKRPTAVHLRVPETLPVDDQPGRLIPYPDPIGSSPVE